MTARMDQLIHKLSVLTARSEETMQVNAELSQALHCVQADLVANENKIQELSFKIDSSTAYLENLTSLTLRTQLLESQTLRDEDNGLSWKATETTIENLQKEYLYLNGQLGKDSYHESDAETDTCEPSESNETSLFSGHDNSDTTLNSLRATMNEADLASKPRMPPIEPILDESDSSWTSEQQFLPVRGFDAPFLDVISEADEKEPQRGRSTHSLDDIDIEFGDCSDHERILELVASDDESTASSTDIIEWYRSEPRCAPIQIGAGRPVVTNEMTDIVSEMSFRPRSTVDALHSLIQKGPARKPKTPKNWLVDLIPNSSQVTSETGRLIGQPAAHVFPRESVRGGAHSTMIINRKGWIIRHGPGPGLSDVLSTRVSHGALRDALRSNLEDRSIH
ncbi:hypothetical protein KL930_000825 [Ogataea haglerorum]|uniref:Uncharacterized protein n=1 Tax=Ogataea haglerorum TaxID=1937702 RepID=A0ABQ7RNR7_9ASCO|nr:hypothetical protein KL915_000827 [Ogataea haglerorum]KAG7712380.1 hypothetical protein KL950_000251 [Ogataea haglerorum]KAG7734686.1 hypothetical protein KL948_000252 [Ogataea haglerorum]KAG7745483.1 hypothetical protein KL932_000513 [Ogataea haglerorum]KAG7761343.1 hypothetical protein KL947_000291 [Ogataea haglerorum]